MISLVTSSFFTSAPSKAIFDCTLYARCQGNGQLKSLKTGDELVADTGFDWLYGDGGDDTIWLYTGFDPAEVKYAFGVPATARSMQALKVETAAASQDVGAGPAIEVVIAAAAVTRSLP